MNIPLAGKYFLGNSYWLWLLANSCQPNTDDHKRKILSNSH